MNVAKMPIKWFTRLTVVMIILGWDHSLTVFFLPQHALHPEEPPVPSRRADPGG